jgi:hypothetical protein
MDTCSIKSRVAATLAIDDDVRATVWTNLDMNLCPFTIILGLHPYAFCVPELLEGMGTALTLNTFGDLCITMFRWTMRQY